VIAWKGTAIEKNEGRGPHIWRFCIKKGDFGDRWGVKRGWKIGKRHAGPSPTLEKAKKVGPGGCLDRLG